MPIEESALVERITKRVLDELERKKPATGDFQRKYGGGGGGESYSVTRFIGLTDTPEDYTGHAGQYPIVNPTEDGLIFDTTGIGETCFLPGFAFDSVIQGSWVIEGGGIQQWCGLLYNTTDDDLDEIHFKLWLQKGTYTMIHLTRSQNDAGIMKTYIDTTLVDTWDAYALLRTDNVRRVVTGISVPTTGLKTLKIKVDGKNASSLNHYCRLSGTQFYRTA